MSRHTLSLVVLLVVVALAVWFVPHALLIGFAGALIAVGLRALAAPLVLHTPLTGGWAVLVVAAAIAVLFSLGIWVAADPLTEQARQFAASLPETLRGLQQRLVDYPWAQAAFERLNPEQMLPSAGDAANMAASGLTGTFGVLGDLVLVLLLALYLASEPSQYRRGFTALLAPDLRPRAMYVLDMAGVTLRGWLVGALCAMAFTGTITWLGLWLLGVPLAPLLGAISALLGFIPYIGPVIAAVPAALVTLGHDPSLLPWALGVYFLGQTIEGNVLTPMVQRRTADLSPALLLMAQTVMGLLSGMLGIALAAPLAAVAVTVVKTAYVEGKLEAE
ncbi:AI-2E family transporter [Roseomonas sp. OT10]|uniref:AI-2E family transporter n=1 Tax=Roseomonas cutis TaxID=2897332 RepID=UPI001E549541|nr:AI-2E family transporter [Roseomonas sp. OT10]UFN47449.1 AI-2E family transporter [Roseomonas sp. OT10]